MHDQSNTAAVLQFPYAVMSTEAVTALYCRLSRDDELQGDRPPPPPPPPTPPPRLTGVPFHQKKPNQPHPAASSAQTIQLQTHSPSTQASSFPVKCRLKK